MSAGIVDDWKYRNMPVTKNDAGSLSELRYYLNVQLRFFSKVDIGKLSASRYLDDIRQIQSILTKIGVVDSSMKNEVQLVLRIIDTTINMLESKYDIR